MAKKFTASSEVLRPDSKFNSKLVSKFINCMMWGGKKSAAQNAFYEAMEIVAEKIKDVPPLEIFETAINNVKPTLEVRSKRVGGASYQVPMQVNPKRQQSLAFRWILASARGKKGKPMAQRLAAEISDAYNRTGGAMTMRENVHRMAEANKAFAHFAW
ncbi:MAG TPA: 30S ribosomal protein S7 [Sedimentisphaerales bacterium]|mgnify:CR=1 FL=1|nr:30S ribosomal protein S7 [Phycisphaerae bacterium]HON91436.1 30S ribosomal protein S7 [Sedimentisphaerales bacterium]HOV76776.1 30S ribosomal protein S7 [Sedimentisphaerales bacterium]HQI28631.1 30S ribosomal protein S7 [Sedimentisphaerales bacterium]